MATRCKVSFFDVEHEIRRSVEVQAASPIAAAEAGLRWMLKTDHELTDFAGTIHIQTITTTDHALPYDLVAQQIEAGSQPEAKVA